MTCGERGRTLVSVAGLAGIGLLFGGAFPAWCSALSHGCDAAIGERFPVWSRTQAVEELRHLFESPPPLSGDFDNNGHRDMAVLIEAPATMPMESGRRPVITQIAICLTVGGRTDLVTIPRPYCSDVLELSPKGSEVHDLMNEVTVLPADGIAVLCWERASALYFLDGKHFREIVTGD